MDRIWAPWRMEYITASSTSDNRCFLCVDSSRDDQALVVGRNNTAFIIMNRFPYTNGHVMVVPIRHVGSIDSLTDEETLDMMRLTKIMVAIFKKEFSVDGLNIGMNLGRAAGAGLEEHCHIHIVPRWFGDTNFMPIFGETRVISEHLHASYERLKRRFLEQSF
ncbi:MAG TPA: HIT domain-containing protein [Syntrophorhabdus sp.]|nr:HIT domain-containing protein [Syntrophorhabdus sp.]OPX92979.1 MAG: AP-4-A phosphorylase [Syntrophorhabdus sp. PtaB.Bin027]OQB77579.1 MAG: AP-4-A phosphorylase [Deltaproteobacteria bacterium ADurb.Bin135]MBP8744479.1 HIT domain-containing protein [Syntrophorhabdus sp.]NMC93401.1 HIT domain-containing protein [Syntrophorhabdus sp.]